MSLFSSLATPSVTSFFPPSFQPVLLPPLLKSVMGMAATRGEEGNKGGETIAAAAAAAAAATAAAAEARASFPSDRGKIRREGREGGIDAKSLFSWSHQASMR